MGCGKNVGTRSARTEHRVTLFVFSCVLIAACATGALLLAYGVEDSTVRVVSLDSITVGDVGDIRYDIESRAETNGGAERIEGWCVLQGVTYHFYNYGNDKYRDEVFNHTEMAFLAGDEVLVVPTKLYQRPDVTASLNDDIDYRFCGFVAQVPAEYVDVCSQAKPCLLLEDPAGTAVLYLLDGTKDQELAQ